MSATSNPLVSPEDRFFRSVPKGIILPWFTKAGNVPPGWAICDGTAPTPDLRGQFLIGVASPAEVGNPFGLPNHSHGFSTQSSDAFGAPDPFKIDDDRSCCPQVTGLAHKHTVTGSTDTRPNIPPSVGVLYIMKTTDSQ